MTWPWVGVDPGGAFTGIVLRDRDRLLAHQVLERGRDNTRRDPGESMASWLDRVVTMVHRFMYGDLERRHPVAVEGLNDPSPHVRITAVRGLIDTAHVIGAVLTVESDAVVVPPAGHGSGPLAAYPPELRPTRGQGRGRDKLKHCRSAWDCALAAHRQQRIETAAKQRRRDVGYGTTETVA